MLPGMNERHFRFTGLLFVLATAWLLWSGIYTPLLIGLGVLSCAICMYLAYRIDFFRDMFSLQVIPRLPHYWGWLMPEIIKSSIDVARIVLHPKLPISPTVVEFDAAPQGPVGQAILGNSITLSPGTITLDVYNGRLRIHCLTRAGADELLSGEFNRRAALLTKD